MKNKCLYCCKEIDSLEIETPAGKQNYHSKCSKIFFDSITPPQIDFREDQIEKLAKQVIQSQKVLTGVQAKLSLSINKNNDQIDRLTIVGLFGEYILKPQTNLYKNLPEIESLTMHLAQLSKLKTVQHSLIRLNSGQLAYITKRIDRNKGNKLHMEDMCQLTEKLTEQKYKGSYEQISKIIQKFSDNPGLDTTDFFELVLFCFLTGNNDMHLKNFSLLKKNKVYEFCPAYDLIASELVVEGDDEELALNLNGKKKKLKHKDFEQAMFNSGLDQKVIKNIFNKFKKLENKWRQFIDQSFLSDLMKEEYKSMVGKKFRQIYG